MGPVGALENSPSGDARFWQSTGLSAWTFASGGGDLVLWVTQAFTVTMSLWRTSHSTS
jgi:hypothetical protein